MSTTPIDFDTPWKEALGEYLRECLALLFPEVHAGIDWGRPHVFLDAELQQVVHDAESGRRYADRLVQVWLPEGVEAWLLIHIEVQSQQETGFPERMFVYYYRLFDRYRREVVSLAVLADEQQGWRPGAYEQGRWGCAVTFRYPVAKLADWRARHDDLLASNNPFATVVLAHLAAQDTRGDARDREQSKLALIRRLYDRGYSREQVLSLFRFIDWLLALPPDLEQRIRQAIEAIEEERQMPYITSIEQIGREEGRLEGRLEGRQEGLQEGRREAKRETLRRIVLARFGAVPAALEGRIAAADEGELDRLIDRALVAESEALL